MIIKISLSRYEIGLTIVGSNYLLLLAIDFMLSNHKS